MTTAELRGVSVVLLGEFNPTIFQPQWFSNQGLLTEQEASTAAVQVIHSDVTIFQLPWVELMVERERFQVSCLAEPYFERVVGLVTQTFGLLSHTPIRSMGINHEAHFKASSMEKWHRLGDQFAPKDFWEKHLSMPGLQSLTIRQTPRQDGQQGYVQVTVEPSARVAQAVYIRVNDHFEKSLPEDLGATSVVGELGAKWGHSQSFANEMFNSIASRI